MANATQDDNVDAVADEQSPEAIQPDRYVENEAHVPNPTDQYGDVLTRGNVDTTRQMESATPIFRQHRAAAAGEDVHPDDYLLTDQQREAARDLSDGDEDAAGAVDDDATVDDTDGAVGVETEQEREQREQALADGSPTGVPQPAVTPEADPQV